MGREVLTGELKQYRVAGVQNALWRVVGENENENDRLDYEENLDATLRIVNSILQTFRSHG